MQITRSMGSFMVKELVYKKFIIAPYRASATQVDILDQVADYILKLDSIS